MIAVVSLIAGSIPSASAAGNTADAIDAVVQHHFPALTALDRAVMVAKLDKNGVSAAAAVLRVSAILARTFGLERDVTTTALLSTLARHEDAAGELEWLRIIDVPDALEGTANGPGETDEDRRRLFARELLPLVMSATPALRDRLAHPVVQRHAHLSRPPLIPDERWPLDVFQRKAPGPFWWVASRLGRDGWTPGAIEWALDGVTEREITPANAKRFLDEANAGLWSKEICTAIPAGLINAAIENAPGGLRFQEPMAAVLYAGRVEQRARDRRMGGLEPRERRNLAGELQQLVARNPTGDVEQMVDIAVNYWFAQGPFAQRQPRMAAALVNVLRWVNRRLGTAEHGRAVRRSRAQRLRLARIVSQLGLDLWSRDSVRRDDAPLLARLFLSVDRRLESRAARSTARELCSVATTVLGIPEERRPIVQTQLSALEAAENRSGEDGRRGEREGRLAAGAYRTLDVVARDVAAQSVWRNLDQPPFSVDRRTLAAARRQAELYPDAWRPVLELLAVFLGVATTEHQCAVRAFVRSLAHAQPVDKQLVPRRTPRLFRAPTAVVGQNTWFQLTADPATILRSTLQPFQTCIAIESSFDESETSLWRVAAGHGVAVAGTVGDETIASRAFVELASVREVTNGPGRYLRRRALLVEPIQSERNGPGYTVDPTRLAASIIDVLRARPWPLRPHYVVFSNDLPRPPGQRTVPVQLELPEHARRIYRETFFNGGVYSAIPLRKLRR